MSKTIFNNIVRSAIWTSYNYTCFYCNRPLEWTDLHIDHIIPEHLINDKSNFKRVINEYGLKNFDINDLVNLIPTHSKCNLRKGGELFTKQTTLYFFELTNKTKGKINLEIQKLNNRKNKGLLISKIQSSIDNKLISTKELESIIEAVKKNEWNNKEIKIQSGIEFIDEVYNSFYFNAEFSKLYDKKMLVGGVYEELDLQNEYGEELKVSTLREWKDATEAGYSAYSNAAMKMSFCFIFLEELLDALCKAMMPKVSFISEPWIGLNNLDYLSPDIFGNGLLENDYELLIEQGMSISELVSKQIISIIDSDVSSITLEYDGLQTSITEQFRADFNGDGIEDIFIQGWTIAIGGTLGFGFTDILTRYSEKHLIQKLK